MASYYLQLPDDRYESAEMIWRISGNIAERVDIYDGSKMHRHEAREREEILELLIRNYPATKFHKLLLEPGEYYPRMARPGSTLPGSSPGRNPDTSAAFRDARAISTGQLHALIQRLQQVFSVVQPTSENFRTFGHEIRNILILGCTEVEAHCKNILAANGKRGRASIGHYALLAPVMKLAEYRVAFPWYPWLPEVSPFADWASGQTLAWYAAYNKVKHDRESQFREATVERALTAVVASFVMLCAQYGWDFARSGDAGSREFFQLVARRTGPLPISICPRILMRGIGLANTSKQT